jgi:hypothetical protein
MMSKALKTPLYPGKHKKSANSMNLCDFVRVGLNKS